MARQGRNSEPQRWCTGPDLLTHLQYRAFVQQRNQALWRREGWEEDFDFETWQSIWQPVWHRRGRERDQLLMTRADVSWPWSEANVVIIDRAEHNRRQVALRQTGVRSWARQRELDRAARDDKS